MSLAENLLNSLSTENISEDYSTDEEEHIVVDNTRKITVPAKLRTIAVEGDKNIETVTIDCVRYWDEHDLSSFAIYINYMLPNGETGTYIPENIIRNDDYFSFNWVIGRNLTKYSGSISFLILARQTDSFGGVLYQWSSLLNSEFNVSKGLEVTSVPEENLTQDIISQILQSLNLKLSYSNISSSTGYEDDLVMSQRATTEELNKRANAVVGNVSGRLVAMDDVSPITHSIKVELTPEPEYGESEVTVKSCGKNVFDSAKPGYSTSIQIVSQSESEIVLQQSYAGSYAMAIFPLPNALAGKTVTISATVKTSGTNSNHFRIMWSNGKGGVSGDAIISSSLSTNTWEKLTQTGIVPQQPNDTHNQLCLLLYSNGGGNTTSGVTYTATYSDIQVEVNNTDTPYEPYTEYEVVDVYAPTEIELTSVAPNMTIFTDNENVTIDATYNKDINKVIEKLTQAIISNGGVV